MYATCTTEANAQGRIPNTNTNVQVITHQSDALVGNILECEKLVIPFPLHQFEHEFILILTKLHGLYVKWYSVWF